MATRTARLEPLRMDDKALWSAAFRLLDLTDPLSLSHQPQKARLLRLELREVLLELRKRGTQLQLFPPAS